MRNYTVTGIDRQSHYDSILVIRATSPENAKAKGETQGIVVTKVVETDNPEPAAAAHDRPSDEPQQGQELAPPLPPEPTSDAGHIATRIGPAIFWLLVVLAIGALIAGVVGRQ